MHSVNVSVEVIVVREIEVAKGSMSERVRAFQEVTSSLESLHQQKIHELEMKHALELQHVHDEIFSKRLNEAESQMEQKWTDELQSMRNQLMEQVKISN